MKSFRWTTWLAATIGAAIVVGCVSEAPDELAGGKSGSDAARPLTDPSLASTGANSPRGNGNDNLNDNGSSGPCDPNCPDFDGDGVIGMQDLAYLLSSFSLPPVPACTDIDGSGLVDLQDLAFLLGSYGTSCSVNGNANDNGTGNTNDNGTGNTNDNGATNTNDNGTGNTNDNGTGNTNDNGAGNTNDNGTGNTNDNGTGNTNDNGAGNTNDNGATNTNDNGTGNTNDNGSGDCPDGSTQLQAGLSDGGDAEYRLFPQGCARFRVRTRGAPPETTLPVTINGVIVGTLTTDDDGRGELRYDTSDGNFPPNFPAVQAGDVVGVGGSISGVLLSDCSSNSNCNG